MMVYSLLEDLYVSKTETRATAVSCTDPTGSMRNTKAEALQVKKRSTVAGIRAESPPVMKAKTRLRIRELRVSHGKVRSRKWK